MADRLTTSLQESVLTLLATSDKQGRIAAGLLTAKSFDDSYKDFAQRIIAFQQKHGKAPGLAHLDDLADDILGNPKHKLHKQFARIVDNIAAQSEGLNVDYVLTRVSEFSRRQTLKGAVLEAAERYQQSDEDLIEDVEGILQTALRFKEEGIEVGTFLSDKLKALAFLDRAQADYRTGVPALDHRNCGPTLGQMLLFIGAKGVGKSWWCIDLAKRCLLQGARVVHISLEMPEWQVSQRYYQNFFALAKRTEPFNVAKFQFSNKAGTKLKDIIYEEQKPIMSLASPRIRRFLDKRIDQWGARFDRLVIKSFPAGSLTIPKLDAYLDSLELTSGMIPTVLVMDYPDLMWLDKANPRLSLGLTFKELRGLLQRRLLAGIMPTQTNRKGWDATTVKASMIGEDASKLMTADMGLIYNQTAEEKKRGLARVFVNNNRGDEDKFTILISQNYTTGQFCLESVRMASQQEYWDLIGDPAPEEAEDDQE